MPLHPTGRAQLLINDALEVVIIECLRAALDGDHMSMKLIIERLLPPRRSSLIKFELPPINTIDEFPEAYGAVLQAVAEGNLTPEEAKALGFVIGQYRQAWEISELLPRLEAVESRLEEKK